MSPLSSPPVPTTPAAARSRPAETRAAVLAAARQLFLDVGYAATTMGAVANAAGVSVETVYKAFGNKPGLVKALFDVAVVGDDEPMPLVQRDFVKRNMAEPDPRRKLLDYGEHYGRVRRGPARCSSSCATPRSAMPAPAEVWARSGGSASRA